MTPSVPGTARLEEIPEPPAADGPLLVEMIALGICGTDREILGGLYGAPAPGKTALILGHECLAKVIEAPAGAALRPGDLVVPFVRRPEPDPCACCSAGEWDMCEDGRFTEHGIQGRDGFAAERFRLDPDSVLKIDAPLGELGVLLEPAGVVAKAWEQIERIGARACFRPRRALVTGAGPIGLLAALFGVARGLEVHVVDRASAGAKPRLVRALGAAYHADLEEVRKACGTFDIALECTGAPSLVMELLCAAGTNSVTCLTGVSSGRRVIPVDMARLNRSIVLENSVVFGTVNANRRHFRAAAAALAAADPAWLSRLVSRRVPLSHWEQAMRPQPDDVKVVLVPG